MVPGAAWKQLRLPLFLLAILQFDLNNANKNANAFYQQIVLVRDFSLRFVNILQRTKSNSELPIVLFRVAYLSEQLSPC